MNVFSVAICDDDLLFAEQTSKRITKMLCEHGIVHSVSRFISGRQLMSAGHFDMVFLDIEMGEMSGLETAKHLRDKGDDCRLVFLTAHKKYVFAAFDVEASHYLVKPVGDQKLEEVLIRFAKGGEKDEESDEAKYCIVRKEGKLFKMPYADISHIEVWGRKISLHGQEGNFVFNGRLEELEQSLPCDFFRCQRSYLVNLAYVTQYDKENITLKDGKIIPIARRKNAEFGKAFLMFLRKHGAEK